MKDKLIVALDYTSRADAERMVETLRGAVTFFKVGPALFLPYGPSIVEYLKSQDLRVFLDMKLHDIPNTLARAAETMVDLEVDIFNLHASGGFEMMAKTAEVVQQRSSQRGFRPIILAVTILTSLKDDFLRDVMGSGRNVKDQVVVLAQLARDAGCDGVVASAWEIEPLKKACGRDFLVLTPGIRPKGAPGYDQKRMKTPGEAVRAGSDFVVIGRPITQASDPRQKALEILKEMEENVEQRTD
jgi:orotidine-5'-phosphate decarboxylase